MRGALSPENDAFAQITAEAQEDSRVDLAAKPGDQAQAEPLAARAPLREKKSCQGSFNVRKEQVPQECSSRKKARYVHGVHWPYK